MQSPTGPLEPLMAASEPSPLRGRAVQTASRFQRNIVRIATGMVASQAIVLAATPLLTRLYRPEDFGALAVFMALHAIIAGLFTLKYELSIILPRDDDKAVELTALTVSISLLLSLLLMAALGAGHFGAGMPAHGYYLLLPLSAVLSAAYTCAQQWGARANDYSRFARSQVLNAVVNVGTTLLLAVVATGLSGSLMAGFVVGLGAGLAYLGYGFWRAHGARRGTAVHLAGLAAAAREYRHFPLYVLPSTFIATLGLSAQPFLLQAMFSMKEVGYYAIASRFLLVPGALIGGAVAEAFRPEFVDRLQRGLEVSSFLRRTLRKLALFALPIFGIFFLVAPPLFELLFGNVYRESGTLSRYLCVGVLAQFVSQPFGYVFVATGHVRLGLLVQSIATAVPLVGLVLGGLSGRIEDALLLSSLLTLAACALLVGLAYRCCKLNDRALAAGAGHV